MCTCGDIQPMNPKTPNLYNPKPRKPIPNPVMKKPYISINQGPSNPNKTVLNPSNPRPRPMYVCMYIYIHTYLYTYIYHDIYPFNSKSKTPGPWDRSHGCNATALVHLSGPKKRNRGPMWVILRSCKCISVVRA